MKHKTIIPRDRACITQRIMFHAACVYEIQLRPREVAYFCGYSEQTVKRDLKTFDHLLNDVKEFDDPTLHGIFVDMAEKARGLERAGFFEIPF